MMFCKRIVAGVILAALFHQAWADNSQRQAWRQRAPHLQAQRNSAQQSMNRNGQPVATPRNNVVRQNRGNAGFGYGFERRQRNRPGQQ